MRSENARMVAEFRHHFNLPVRSRPDPFRADLDLHTRLLIEEVLEFALAVADRNPIEILDAITDIIYVAYGAALDCGFDADEAFRIVHASNMAKLGPDGRPIVDDTGKVRKPDGWMPPDLRELAGI